MGKASAGTAQLDSAKELLTKLEARPLVGSKVERISDGSVGEVEKCNSSSYRIRWTIGPPGWVNVEDIKIYEEERSQSESMAEKNEHEGKETTEMVGGMSQEQK